MSEQWRAARRGGWHDRSTTVHPKHHVNISAVTRVPHGAMHSLAPGSARAHTCVLTRVRAHVHMRAPCRQRAARMSDVRGPGTRTRPGSKSKTALLPYRDRGWCVRHWHGNVLALGQNITCVCRHRCAMCVHMSRCAPASATLTGQVASNRCVVPFFRANTLEAGMRHSQAGGLAVRQRTFSHTFWCCSVMGNCRRTRVSRRICCRRTHEAYGGFSARCHRVYSVTSVDVTLQSCCQ